MTDNDDQLDFDALLGDGNEFEELCTTLGRFMVRGLNQLPATTLEMVDDCVAGGARVAAVVTTDPAMIRAVLCDKDRTVELFTVTESGPTIN